MGFCFDTIPDPRPNSTGNLNHTQGVLDGKKFTGDFPWFDAYQKYYFRAYAVTFEGDYVFSGQSVLDTIHAKRVVPTCNPTFGRINLGSSNIQYVSSAETPELGIYGYEIEVRSNNNWFDIEFGEYPISGIYKTTQQDPEENQIRIAIFGPGGGVLDGGTNVYINQLGPKKWNMVICDAKYTFVNAKLTFSSNFDFPK